MKMLNLEAIHKYRKREADEALVLESDKRRVVVLELNAAEPCQLMLQTGSADLRFLANVHGHAVLRFVADGPVAVYPDTEGELWWWTPEFEETSTVSDAATFTTIAERRARNPELERIVRVMHENAERRHAAVMAEVQSTVGALRAENQALKQKAKTDDGTDPAATAGGNGGSGAAKAKRKPVEPAAQVEPADGGGGEGADE